MNILIGRIMPSRYEQPKCQGDLNTVFAHGNRLKILISAYACDPWRGSEQGFAWSWIMKCSKRHDITVVTCEAQRSSIESALSSRIGNVRFVYVKGQKRVSPSGVEHKFERIKAYLWQLRAIPKVRKLCHSQKFSVVQHLSIGTWRISSCLAFVKVPLILGPLSGSEELPPGFERYLSLKGFLWTKIRGLLIRQAWCDPLVRYTLRRAAKILVCGPKTYSFLVGKFGDKVEFYTRAFRLPELAETEFSARRRTCVNTSIRLVWMGQLIPRKGLDLLIRAMADIRLSNCVLDIIGEGPEEKRYKRRLCELKIDNRVRFLGRLRRSQALSKLREYDIFVFTSLQDMMGQALSEALQMGLPCVVMDWGGPRTLVGENGAAKVEISTFDNTCKNLADTLVRLCSDPELRVELSKNAIKRIRDLTDPVKLDSKRDQVFADVSKKPHNNL